MMMHRVSRSLTTNRNLRNSGNFFTVANVANMKYFYYVIVMLLPTAVHCRTIADFANSSASPKNKSSDVLWVKEDFEHSKNVVVVETTTFTSVDFAFPEFYDVNTMSTNRTLFDQLLSSLLNLYEKGVRLGDKEEMQADARQLSNDSSESDETNQEELGQKIAKENRVKTILQQIWEATHKEENLPPKNYTHMLINLTLPSWPAPEYVPKTESLYPECLKSKQLVYDDFAKNKNIHLNFNVNFPQLRDDMRLNISSAELRLFKMPVQYNEIIKENLDDISLFSDLEEALEKSNVPKNVANVTLSTTSAAEKKIQVTIFYYAWSKRENRLKKRRLDTCNMTMSKAKIKYWDVRKIMSIWKRDESSKDYGITVEVCDFDDSDKILPAYKYFKVMDCSTDDVPPPLPKLALQNLKNKPESRKFYNQAIQLPVLHLTSVEVPVEEIAYNSTKQAIEKLIRNIPQSEEKDTSSSNTPKIRHENKKKS